MASRGGQPGNNNAAKGAVLSSKLRARLEERAKQNEIIDALIDKACEGDLSAIKEVFDRLDGKAKQSLDVDASITVTDATQLTDDQLANIASTGSE